jgi:hypothetical protein
MKIGNKGDVPIPYIIALILGVIVIALLAYWIFFSGGNLGTIITEKGCEAKKMGYCNEYKTTGKAPKQYFSGIPCATVTAPANKDNYYAPECCTLTWANGGIDLCK